MNIEREQVIQEKGIAMRARGSVYSWGVALVGGIVLGYAFGMRSVALGLHPDKTVTQP